MPTNPSCVSVAHALRGIPIRARTNAPHPPGKDFSLYSLPYHAEGVIIVAFDFVEIVGGKRITRHFLVLEKLKGMQTDVDKRRMLSTSVQRSILGEHIL